MGHAGLLSAGGFVAGIGIAGVLIPIVAIFWLAVLIVTLGFVNISELNLERLYLGLGGLASVAVGFYLLAMGSWTEDSWGSPLGGHKFSSPALVLSPLAGAVSFGAVALPSLDSVEDPVIYLDAIQEWHAWIQLLIPFGSNGWEISGIWIGSLTTAAMILGLIEPIGSWMGSRKRSRGHAKRQARAKRQEARAEPFRQEADSIAFVDVLSLVEAGRDVRAGIQMAARNWNRIVALIPAGMNDRALAHPHVRAIEKAGRLKVVDPKKIDPPEFMTRRGSPIGPQSVVIGMTPNSPKLPRGHFADVAPNIHYFDGVTIRARTKIMEGREKAAKAAQAKENRRRKQANAAAAAAKQAERERVANLPVAILDGTNIALTGINGGDARLDFVLAAKNQLEADGHRVHSYWDARAFGRLDATGKATMDKWIAEGWMQMSPNSHVEADLLIMEHYGMEKNAIVVTGDRFRDHHESHPWTKDRSNFMVPFVVKDKLLLAPGDQHAQQKAKK